MKKNIMLVIGFLASADALHASESSYSLETKESLTAKAQEALKNGNCDAAINMLTDTYVSDTAKLMQSVNDNNARIVALENEKK
jgi:hypothetical protein